MIGPGLHGSSTAAAGPAPASGAAAAVYVALGATDMRKGFEGLFGLVRDQLGADPLSGELFLFSNRTRTRLKALWWDGTGLWVCAKRLERGRFFWPELPAALTGAATASAAPRRVRLSRAELTLLLDGIDLKQSQPRAGWYRR